METSGNTSKEGELIKAATTKDFSKISQLVSEGININAQDSQGKTALMMSLVPNFKNDNVLNLLNTHLENDDMKITNFLLEKGADVNIQNARGDTSLIFATELGNIDAMKLLIDKGADVNITNNKNENALFYTPNNEVHAVVMEMMTALIDAKINVNQQDERGENILMKLINSGKPYASIEYIELLLKNDVNLLSKDMEGHNVMEMAYLNKDNLDRDVIEVIERKYMSLKPRFGINITHTAKHFDLIEGIEQDVLIADYIKEDPMNVVIMYNTNQYFFTTSSIIKNAYLDRNNIVFGCPTPDSYRNVDKTTSYFNLRSIGLITDYQFCNMSAFLKNEESQLFVVYGMDKKYPSFTSYTNLRNPTYDSAVGGLHCQGGQNSHVAHLYMGYPALENNTIPTKQPTNTQNNIEMDADNTVIDESDTESDDASVISETQPEIERREFFGEGKKRTKPRKTKRKNIYTKKGKRTRNNKPKI